MRTKIIREMFDVMDMMEKENMIKRYEEFCDGVAESEDGEYVKLEDVKHLLSPWKDASKGLPPKEHKGTCMSIRVLIKCDIGINKKGIVEAQYYYQYESWEDVRTCHTMHNVTHFMYIPEIKEEG